MADLNYVSPLTSDLTDYYTKQEVDELQQGDVDKFATAAQVVEGDNAVKGWVVNQNYLTEHQSLADYATKTYVDEAIDEIEVSGVSIEVVSQLPEPEDAAANTIYLVLNSQSETGNIYDEYIYVPAAEDFELIGDTSSGIIPDLSDYATKVWVGEQGFLTQHQDLSSYALKSELPDVSGFVESSDLSSAAFSGDYDDLVNKPVIPSTSGLASETYVDEAIAAIDIPDTTGMATQTWVNQQGFLTQHQDISGKANSADLATVATTGSYNDLTNKPTIPSVSGLASETYVDNAIGALSIPTTASEISFNNAGTALDGTDVQNAISDLDGNLSTVMDAVNNLATVATSGSYNDLSNKPTIPSISGLATETYVDNAVAAITVPDSADDISFDNSQSGMDSVNVQLAIEELMGNFMYVDGRVDDLATVATSGSYNDLSNKPTIPSTAANIPIANATGQFEASNVEDALDEVKGDTLYLNNQFNDLATVATSGSYNDLSDKPTIPVLPTLATVATTGSYNDLTNTPSVPTADGSSIVNSNGVLSVGTIQSTNIPVGDSLTNNSTIRINFDWFRHYVAELVNKPYPNVGEIVITLNPLSTWSDVESEIENMTYTYYFGGQADVSDANKSTAVVNNIWYDSGMPVDISTFVDGSTYYVALLGNSEMAKDLRVIFEATATYDGIGNTWELAKTQDIYSDAVTVYPGPITESLEGIEFNAVIFDMNTDEALIAYHKEGGGEQTPSNTLEWMLITDSMLSSLQDAESIIDGTMVPTQMWYSDVINTDLLPENSVAVVSLDNPPDSTTFTSGALYYICGKFTDGGYFTAEGSSVYDTMGGSSGTDEMWVFDSISNINYVNTPTDFHFDNPVFNITNSQLNINYHYFHELSTAPVLKDIMVTPYALTDAVDVDDILDGIIQTPYYYAETGYHFDSSGSAAFELSPTVDSNTFTDGDMVYVCGRIEGAYLDGNTYATEPSFRGNFIVNWDSGISSWVFSVPTDPQTGDATGGLQYFNFPIELNSFGFSINSNSELEMSYMLDTFSGDIVRGKFTDVLITDYQITSVQDYDDIMDGNIQPTFWNNPFTQGHALINAFAGGTGISPQPAVWLNNITPLTSQTFPSTTFYIAFVYESTRTGRGVIVFDGCSGTYNDTVVPTWTFALGMPVVNEGNVDAISPNQLTLGNDSNNTAEIQYTTTMM